MGTERIGRVCGCVCGLVLLLAGACGGDDEDHPGADGAVDAGGTSSGGSASSSGGSASSSGGGASSSGGGTTGASGGSASGGSANGGVAGVSGEGGEGGEAGTGGNGGVAAAGGSGGTSGEPWCVPEVPVPEDDCVYPESLGGGVSPTVCGVTAAAWYPLGDSEPIAWPKRALWDSASGEGVSASWGTVRESRVAFDAQGRLVVTWLDDQEVRARRWSGAGWTDLAPIPRGRATLGSVRSHDLAVDSSGIWVAERFERAVRVVRYDGSSWEKQQIWAADTLSRGDHVMLAVDADDHVTAIWNEVELISWRWDGSAWDELGDVGVSTNHTTGPSLALLPDGSPLVAWYDAAPYSGGPVMLQHFVDGVWEGFGDSLTDAIGVSEGAESVEYERASVGVASDESIVVTWRGSFRAWRGDAWQPIQSFAGTEAGSVLATNSSGALFALTLDQAGVSQWVDDGFESFESPELPAGPGHLAVSASDELAVSVVAPNREAFLKVHRDGAWHALGVRTAAGEGVMIAEDAQLLLNDDGSGFLVGHPEGPESECAIQRWDDDAWQPLALPDGVGSPYRCVGAVDHAGRLVLAFTTDFDADGDYLVEELRVMRQTDTDWEDLGIVHESSKWGEGWAREYALAVDSTNAPFVFHSIYDNSGDYFAVRHWDGAGWSSLNGGTGWEFALDGEFSVYEPRILVTPDDRPVVAGFFAFEDVHAQLLEWTGDAWEAVAAATVPLPRLWEEPNMRRSFKLALDSSGAPVVSWRDGNALQVLTGSGGTSTVTPATEALLETLPESMRWDARVERGDIRVSRAEDCHWTGLSASHRGGGISNTAAPSFRPSLAFAGDRVCAAWSEYIENEWRVFVRCHD